MSRKPSTPVTVQIFHSVTQELLSKENTVQHGLQKEKISTSCSFARNYRHTYIHQGQVYNVELNVLYLCK
jgi:hypothetical protein